MYFRIIYESKQQNKPAIATVVNLGVSFFHRKDTENTENPKAEAKPNNNPIIEFDHVVSLAITPIPKVAIAIDIHTLIDICSFKNKKPSKAVINGIAAKHNNCVLYTSDAADEGLAVDLGGRRIIKK